MSADDFASVEEVVKTATLLLVPDDQTQRQVFEKLMPHLYVLRNKGCSFAQLTKLLNQCGVNLQPSTVRTYYSEMLADRLDICQARMNESIAVMAAVRSETAGVDISAISDRVQAFMHRQKQVTSAKVDSVFGATLAGRAHEAEQAPRAIASSPAVSAPKPVQARPPAAGRRAAPSAPRDDTPADDTPSSEFGLLGLSGQSQPPSHGPAGFFTLDTDPSSPPPAAEPAERKNLRGQARAPSAGGSAAVAPAPAPADSAESHNTATTPPPGAIRKRISPLQDGVPALKQRDSVPAHVYEPGELEHPAIPGLMLNLEQRLYGAGLEYCDEEGDEAGVLKVETPDEKRFRVTWRQPIPMTQTRTGSSFTRMDPALFPTKS
ncbi:hypothetical protein [Ralstonia pseudosolanacearum]|uniref:hypothetical protein n=1 Tax=Ralstonia pseudosolanacearum TaxID=1310165 RepID=UPI001FFB223B|nr:hypothetical protein [Ralstonia pseudosolanacearum]